MKDHVGSIAQGIDLLIDAYEAAHDCDVNDILSAVALVLVQRCQDLDVPRMSMLANLSSTYEQWESARKEMH